MFSRIVRVVAMMALVGGVAQAQVKSPKVAPTATKLAPPAEDAPAVPLLAAPRGVTVTATSNGPQVAWKSAAGATSYQVLRAASAQQKATSLGVSYTRPAPR